MTPGISKDYDPTFCAVNSERIHRIEQDVRDMYKSLHGNGQPGLIDRFDERIDHLEKKIAKLTIVVVAISASGGAGLTALIQSLMQ